MAVRACPMELVEGRMEAVQGRMGTMVVMATLATAIRLHLSAAIARLGEVLHQHMAAIMRHYSISKRTLPCRGITNEANREGYHYTHGACAPDERCNGISLC